MIINLNEVDFQPINTIYIYTLHLTHYMKLYRKFIVPIIAWVILLWWLFCIWQNIAQLKLVIKWQWLIIWTPANMTASNLDPWDTEVFDFNDYFRIEDLRWSKNWHYTSIQWLVYWWDGEFVTWAIVYFKTNSENFTVILGTTEGDENFNRNLTGYVDISEPTILFYRNDNINRIWFINRLWFKPSIKVTVPNDAPSWPYSLRLSYTLYDMPVTIE